MNILNRFRLALAGAVMLTLAACGGGGGSASGDGTLRLALTDAPACGFDKVNVTVQKVRVHQSASAADTDGGWSEIVLSPAQRVDLLSLTNGVLLELGQTPLPPGKYTQLRLVLADNSAANPLANSVVPTGGTETALTTPSGQQSGVKIAANIDIAANQMADFVLDFDACKSVSVVGAGHSGRYLLKPQLRLIPRFVNGVQGFVTTSLANGLATATLQQGGVVVRATVSDSTGRFLLQPVDPGSYTLVVTSAGKTTMVVTSVPVVAETVTTVNSTTTALTPAASATGTLNGTVTTGVTPVEASVRALQTLTSGVIEVAGRPVEADTGLYSYVLPVAAPQVAPYVALPGTLTFVADAAAAGKYTLAATALGVTKPPVGPLTVTAGGTQATNFSFP